MLTNYFKIAWRNLLKHRMNNFLNITGLALGLACCLLISFYIREELSYDKGFEGSENIYRITEEAFGEEGVHWAATSPVLGTSMKEYFPQIAEATRLYMINSRIFTSTSENTIKQFEEKRGYYADSSLFSLFRFKFASGNPQTALDEINTIVLTQTMAKKYFGNANALGKTIMIAESDSDRPLRVTGILEESSFNTHLEFDYLISMPTAASIIGNLISNRNWNGFYTYVKLNEGSSLESALKGIPDFLAKFYAGPDISREQILAAGILHFQPVSDIHLRSKLEKEMGPNSDIKYVYIFSSAALLILFIACINFINLSTVQALKRIKEIGVRKTIGASKAELIRQFLGETILQTFIAVLLALVFFKLALPYYEVVTGKTILFREIISPFYLFLLPAIIVLTGLISGLYPAYFASGFDPVSALKGKRASDFSIGTIRKGLIVLQFVVSVFLIAGTIIIYQQMRLFSSTNLGFSKDQVIVVKLSGDLKNKATLNPDLIKHELLGNPAVKNVSFVSRPPGERLGIDNVRLISGPSDSEPVGMRFMWADHDYLSTLDVTIKDGRNFFKNSQDSLTSYLVNEAAAKALGLKEPLGQIVNAPGGEGRIVGFINDYNFASLHSLIEPLIILSSPAEVDYMLVKGKGEMAQSVLSFLREEINKISPSSLFNYTFLDDNLEALYASEKRTENIFNVFTGFALLISCLGLFGISSYTARLRTKEIGIRKVLGASEGSLISLLTQEFIKLVLIAFVIASPISWWLMHSWLEDFAYRTEIQWWVFLVAGLIAVSIALVTISFQAIKAAMMNPVNSLRSE